MANIFPLYHKGLINGVFLEWHPSGRSSHLCGGSPVRLAIGFLVTTLTKVLLAWSLSLARQPALGGIPIVPNPNIFHVTMMEPTVLLGAFKAWFYTLAQIDLCLDTLWKQRSMKSSLDFHGFGFFLVWDALWIVGPYTHKCKMFNQLNLPQVDSSQTLETSQDDQNKQDAPELNP